MADFLGVFLITFVVIFLSYLYWQWRTKEKHLADQSRNRPLLSRDDMLKHRLKRFELKGDESDDDTSSILEKQYSTRPIDESVSKDFDAMGEEKEVETLVKSEDVGLNASPGTLQSDSMQVFQETSTNKRVQSETNTAKAKPVNPRKWVTLSISDSDNKSDPVTQPLTSLDELRAWTEGFDELNVSSVLLRRVGNDLKRRPRTIVCHDMKGGYVQDR